MAGRVTDAKKKKIIAEYLECGSYNATAKKYGVSDKTVKRIVEENPDFTKIAEHKKEQNSSDVLAYMEAQKDIVCSIIGKGLAVLNDDEKLASATPAQITTALGTLIDKFTTVSGINEARADDPLSKSLEELARKGLKSDDR